MVLLIEVKNGIKERGSVIIIDKTFGLNADYQEEKELK